MKTLVEVVQNIFEGEEKDNEIRAKLKFLIYKEDGKTVDWLKDREDYQKIECNYEDEPDFDDGIKVSFLLGRKDGTWQLWAGKPGVVTYADEPYKDLETEKFEDAIMKSLDKAEDLIKQIKDEPNNWVQFFVNVP